MSVFEPVNDGVEVQGSAILAIVNGVPGPFAQRAEQILADNGIDDLREEGWYPQDAYLDAYEEIAQRVGSKTLRQIGRAIPENAAWPPGVETPLAALKSIDDAYHMNHRGGEVGYYEVTRLDDTSARVECKNPYPCEFDQGLIEGTARAFTDTLTTLEKVEGTCRDEGDDVCIYEIEW
jgi:predicted hydrocarbon binding protein